MHALRLARAATGRHRVVRLEGSCHGWHNAVAPDSESVLPAVRDATLAVPYNDAVAAGQESGSGSASRRSSRASA